MRCPTCDRELRPAARGEVELDCCPACRGAWLEPDELDKLMDWLPEGPEWPGAPVVPANGRQKNWRQGIRFYDFG